jgi:hypothetical protein
MSNVRQTGQVDRDVKALVDEVNRNSELVRFTVGVAGTEEEITHGMGSVPLCAIQVAEPSSNGAGVVCSGPTAWTTRKIYLTASATGDYAVIIRR